MEDLTSCLTCITCRVRLSHCLLLLAVMFVPQIAIACDKFIVSGLVFHESLEGTYERQSRALNCRSLPVYQQKGNGYYLFYAYKPTQVSGGWVIGARRCSDYEDSLIVSDSGPKEKVQDVTTWQELPYGVSANGNVQVQCSSSSGLSAAAVAALTTCLILLAVFILMLIFTVRRWRQRKKRRRQHLENLRTIPSISGRVSYRGQEQMEQDLPPSYHSIIQSDQAMTDSATLPPSYQEVSDNPSYVQIHSPLSTGGINNPAFDFDTSTGEVCL